MTGRRSKGEGSLYYWEDKKLWVAQITLPDGKRKKKYSKTQKVAKEWLLEFRKSIKDDLWVSSDQVTISQFLGRFLSDTVSLTSKPKTIESYTYLINKHIEPTLGNLKLTELKPYHLQALYAKKVESGLSNRTVQYIHAVIHRGLEQALKWGLITRNVADLVEAPKPVKKEIQTFSIEQSKFFLQTIREDRLYPLYALAIGCGLRLGELLALQWEDINLETGTVSIRRTAQYIPGSGMVMGEPKSEKSRRSVAVPQFALEALKGNQASTGRVQGLVFQTGNGTPFSERNMERHFHAVLNKAGLPRIRFHDLRHTAATLLLIEGVHPKVVQEMLGHSQIGLTMDTYSHVIPSMQKDAAEKMQNLFNKV